MDEDEVLDTVKDEEEPQQHQENDGASHGSALHSSNLKLCVPGEEAKGSHQWTELSILNVHKLL